MLIYKNISINSKDYYHPIILKKFIKLLFSMNHDIKTQGCYLWTKENTVSNIASDKLSINDPTYEKYGFMTSHLPTEFDLLESTLYTLHFHNEKKRNKLFKKGIKRLIKHDKKGYEIPMNYFINQVKYQIVCARKMYYKYHEQSELDFIKLGEKQLKILN